MVPYHCSLLTYSAQVTVQPESIIQAEGLEAVFECFYPGQAIYDWFINGSLVFTNSPFSNVRLGEAANRLIILAIPGHCTTI